MAEVIMAEAPVAIGYDRNGLQAFYALTPCCAASGKGGERGVICRGCYRDVDSLYGGFWYADEHAEMIGGFNLAGSWNDYVRLLQREGVPLVKAEELRDEAVRQAALL